MSSNLNITCLLQATVEQYGDEVAVVVPRLDAQLQLVEETVYTYRDMYQRVAQYQAGLKAQGYRKGDRIIVLLPVDVDIYGLLLAIWSIGAVVVFLDPGIGLKKIITALQDSRAKAIVSIERLLKFRWLIPPLWFKTKYCADGSGLFLKSLEDLKDSRATTLSIAELAPEDHVLITYTGGTTGRAKGTNRNARNTFNQFQVIRASWAFDHAQVDFPSFPMFGLINLYLGVKTVVPAVDFARVGDQSSPVIVRQIQEHAVTRMSGAPRFIGTLTDYAYAHDIRLPTVQHMILGGAPITRELGRKMQTVFPNADIKMVYGSTEAAPIAYADLPDLLSAEGQGGLVGRPVADLEVKVVKLAEVHPAFDGRGATPFEQKAGELGEIIIKGPHVVQGYVDNVAADLTSKIADVDGSKWHRTGDMGYFDGQGRLWLTGRKADVIQFHDRELHPYPIEQQLDALPHVRRSAIVHDTARNILQIAIETDTGFVREKLDETLIALNLSVAEVHLLDQIPVDDRHNSKINRIALRKLLG